MYAGLEWSDLSQSEKFLFYVGRPAAWLKKKWVFRFVLGIFTFGSVVVMTVGVSDEGGIQSWVPLSVIIAAGLAILASIGDAVADEYDARLSDLELAEAEAETEVAVADLNSFIEQCMEATRASGAKRKAMLESLKAMLVTAAAKSLPSSRASYYTLHRDVDNNRILGDPKHHSEGRDDRSDRPFLESADPHLTVWSLLDRADTEAQLVEYPDDRDGIEWDKVSYRSYYSIPVKHKSTVYGMLSVNSAHTGVINGAHRRAILAMARVYAMALLAAEPKTNRR